MALRSAKVVLTADASQAIRESKKLGDELDATAGRAERAGGRADRAAQRVGTAGRNIFAAGAAGLAVMEKANIDFDRGMSKAGAASLDTSKSAAQTRQELDKLRDAAIKAGADTSFSATEAAGGITELAKAGVSTQDILSGGLRGALDLAAAGNIAVGDAAEYVATSLTQFGLKGDKATHVADLLAAGAGKAQGEVSDMALALDYAGIPAAELGVSIEETAGTIALFASNGLIGEKAGTALRGVLGSLTAPSKQAAGLMKELGVEVFDAQGKFVGFDGVAGQLQESMAGLTDKEKAYYLGKIFGREQMQAANILLREGADGVKKWTEDVDDQNYAGEQAARMMDNLAGDIEKVKGSLESAFINGGGGFQDALRDIAQGVGGAIDRFNELPDAVQENSVKAVAALTATGGLLWAVTKVKGGIDTLRGGAGISRGVKVNDALSSARVVPVVVTNWPPGFGGVGGPGGGDTVVGGGTTGDGQRTRPRPQTRTGRILRGAATAGSVVGGPLAWAGLALNEGVKAAGGNDVFKEFGDATDTLKRTRKATDEVSGGFLEVRKALQQTNVGKYAKDLGLDLNRLAADIAINGDQGKYLDDTMRRLSDGGLKDAAAGIADFITPGWDSEIKKRGRAVDDLGRVASSTGEKVGDLGKKKATPSVEPKGAERASVLFGGLSDKVDLLGRKRPTVPVKAEDRASGVISGIIGFLGRIPRRVVTVVETQRIETRRDAVRASQTQVGGPPGGADGGRVVAMAGGGTVPGQRLPYGDSVYIYAAPGEEIITNRRGEADRFRADRAAGRIPAYADGGTVGAQRLADGGTVKANLGGVTIVFPDPVVSRAVLLDAQGIAVAAELSARSTRDTQKAGLQLMQQQQRINQLTGQLNETEKYGKGKKKKSRLAVRGYDRQVLEAELAEEHRVLVDLQKRQDEVDAAIEKFNDEQATHETERTTLAEAFYNVGVGSRATASGSLSQTLRDTADLQRFGSVMGQLQGKASPALLRQVLARAEGGDIRSAIRLGQALLNQPVLLGQFNAALDQRASVAGSLASAFSNPAFFSGSPFAGAQQIVQLAKVEATVTTLDPSLVAREAARIGNAGAASAVTQLIRN